MVLIVSKTSRKNNLTDSGFRFLYHQKVTPPVLADALFALKNAPHPDF